TDPNDIKFGYSYETLKLCSTERFNGDPTWGVCSGTLIDDDLILTAGHCARSLGCSNMAFAFNYLRDQAGAVNKLPTDDVFFCNSVVTVSAESDVKDYAVIRLDRAATPRYRPIPIQPYAKPLVDHTVALIGAPTGIPLKIDDSGTVLLDGTPTFQITNDAFH